MKKPRWLVQALILSMALNALLMALFFYLLLRKEPVLFSFKPKTQCKSEQPDICASLPLLFADDLDYPSLLNLLNDQRMIGQGYSVRDFALGSLVDYWDFDLKRALGKDDLQMRQWKIEEKNYLLFPGLNASDFEQVFAFVQREKFPFTLKGLFKQIDKETIEKASPELLQFFCHSTPFILLETLFARTTPQVPMQRKEILALAIEGGWDLFDRFYKEQENCIDFSIATRQSYLLSALDNHSATAAQLMIKIDPILPENQEIVGRYCEKTLRPAFRQTPPAAPCPTTHLIQPGESLWLIAKKYRVTIDALMESNHLQSTVIRPGKSLTIPPPG